MLSYDLDVDVTDLGPSATSLDIKIGSTTYFSSVGLGTYTISGLTTGVTVVIVDNASALCPSSDVINMCSACEDAPFLPSDECVNAPNFTLSQIFAGSTSCSYSAGVDPDAGTYCGTIENDSWLSFTASATDVEIEYSVGDCGGSSNGIQLSVYSGSCGSLTEISGSCLDYASPSTTGSWNFSGLTIGDTYYIWIDGYAGANCDYVFTAVSGVVLPVSLSSFNVACNGNNVQINWSTESETNNDYFTIERSTDAINFEVIATVAGNGNSSIPAHYTWTDDSQLSGIVYYRLKQTDFNGAFEYHGIRIANCEQSTDISIYPNPFENSFTVQLSENTTYPITVKVLDYLGRQVHTETIETGTKEIKLNRELPTGTYFVKIVTQTIQVVERMVKLK